MTYREAAIKAAKNAGKLLLDNHGKIREFQLKRENDFVTNLDKEAESIIISEIKANFPEHNIIAEESGKDNKKSEYTWHIDPLGGTFNYMHSLSLFSISISLFHKNNVILGVVYDPMLDELFVAETKKGAYLNNQKISVSDRSKLEDSLICIIIKKHSDEERKKSMNCLTKLFSKSNIRFMPSTGLSLCYIACGRTDGFIEISSDIFSTPAGKLILEEAGGKVTDIDDKEWNINSKDTLASNGKIHTLIIDALH